jgi:beta-1,4-mannosyltransferase
VNRTAPISEADAREAKRAVVNVPFAGGNPYQALLYSAPDMGYDLVRGSKYGFAEIADGAERGGPRLVHLHWDDRMFGRSEDPDENAATAAETLREIERFRAAGGRILWTIHNERPHMERDIDAFEAARAALCGLVDLIHVHAPHAGDHMRDTYGVPAEKLRVIPHPSYLGTYEPAETTLARPMPVSERREFLFFGAMRGKKGLAPMFEAVKRLTRRSAPFHMSMYGKGFREARRGVRRMRGAPTLTASLERVPDAEIPGLFGAAQVFLAPFTSVFTSGTVMLAQTFGLPVIGPDVPAMRQMVPEACHGLLFDPEGKRPLLRKMHAVIDMDDAELAAMRTACFRFAEDRSPERISRQLGAALDEIAI